MTHAPMPGQDALDEPLRSRWSPALFDDTHVIDAEQVTTLLQAARWAPSSGNQQPWRFLVAERGTPTHQAIVPHLSRGNSWWAPRASLILIVCTQTGAAPEEEPAASRKPAPTPLMAGYNAGQAAAHLTVQAGLSGLDVHQFAGFDHDAVARVLEVPAHFSVVAGIAVGRHVGHDADPAVLAGIPEREREREGRPRSRRPLEETAFAGRWGAPWITAD